MMGLLQRYVNHGYKQNLLTAFMPACSVQPASGVERWGGGNIPREDGSDCVSARPPWGFLGAAPAGAGIVPLPGLGSICVWGTLLPRKRQNRGSPRVDWRRHSRSQSTLGLTDYSKKQPRKRVARNISGTDDSYLRTLRMRGGAWSGRRGGCRRGRGRRG